MRSAPPVPDTADRIVLSEPDAELALELPENPPRPTEALIAAARRRTHG
jgi:uncharacterized protein (DUF1778 family)